MADKYPSHSITVVIWLPLHYYSYKDYIFIFVGLLVGTGKLDAKGKPAIILPKMFATGRCSGK